MLIDALSISLQSFPLQPIYVNALSTQNPLRDHYPRENFVRYIHSYCFQGCFNLVHHSRQIADVAWNGWNKKSQQQSLSIISSNSRGVVKDQMAPCCSSTVFHSLTVYRMALQANQPFCLMDWKLRKKVCGSVMIFCLAESTI